MKFAKEALAFAVEAHKGQKDKGKKPYIYHPIYVAEHVEGDIAKSVAYLHDVVEDTKYTSYQHLNPLIVLQLYPLKDYKLKALNTFQLALYLHNGIHS